MSLGITARGDAGQLKFEKLTEAVRSIAYNLGFDFSMTDSEGRPELRLTDNGIVTVSYGEDDNSVTIDSQTSVMGPGFHVLTVEFIDALIDITGIELEVDDETEYYSNRDFAALQRDHFCLWVSHVVGLIREKKDENVTDLMLNWDMSWPVPENISGSVVTPFGRFNINRILEFIDNESIEAFASRLFPCWEMEIDRARVAWYDALYMLWVKCYYEPSSRSDEDAVVNAGILERLEMAISAGISVPHAEYSELCGLAGHQPLDLTGIEDYRCDYTIGFRRCDVGIRIGNVTFRVPGKYLYFSDDDNWGYWGGYDGSEILRVYAAGSHNGKSPEFINNDPTRAVEYGEIRNGKYMLCDLGWDSGSHITQIHLITQNQFTLFTISAPLGTDVARSLERARSFIQSTDATERDLTELINRMTAEDRHSEVIGMLLNLPPEKLTDELKGQLARAYNNSGEYEKALPLLEESRSTQENTANWNFRMGYSYYYLGDYSKSLKYFQRADDIEPEDDDTLWFIAHCRINIPFDDRVKRFWDWFRDNTTELERLMNDKREGWQERISSKMDEGLALIDSEVFYNIGGCNELTLCVESQTECHYLYPYLVDAMPEELKDKWKVYPCKQPCNSSGFKFGMYGKEIAISDLMVRSEFDPERRAFSLRYYHPALEELEDSQSINAFYIMLELTIGEGAVFNYIANVEQAHAADDMYSVCELSAKMKAALEYYDSEYNTTPHLSYFQYSCEPAEDEERVRFDIICGTTQYPALNSEYVNGERRIFDSLASKGVNAMMLVITQPDGMDRNSFLAFRYMVEDRLDYLFGKGIISGRLLGGAYGAMGVAYIDLLIYNTPGFMEYLETEDRLEDLLRMDNGKVCPGMVFYKDFIQNSQIFRLR